MPGKKPKTRPGRRGAGKRAKRQNVATRRRRGLPGRAARVARRPAAVRRLATGRPAMRAIHRAAVKKAMNRAALARIRLVAAVGAVERAGSVAGASLRETQAAAAREAVAAIKAAEKAIEAAQPHGGDRSEEE